MQLRPMDCSRLAAPALAWFATAASLLGQATDLAELMAVRQAEDSPAMTKSLRSLVRGAAERDAALAVGVDGRLLHLGSVGDFDADRVVPIASASKWLTVATILSLCEDGILDLDQALSRYLPEFDTADKRLITLRQCLSCTAGFPAQSQPARKAKDMTACAKELADEGLKYAPGTEFVYGGTGFQAAACAAVRASKRTWHELFEERIGRPLGMHATAFGEMLPAGRNAGACAVPWVAGGAVSSLRDYERFCAMLAGGGELEGVAVLRKTSVAEMLRPQLDSSRMTVRFPGLHGDLNYGLGTWVQTLDSGLVRASDPGAFGFLPWVDVADGVYGVLAIESRVQKILPRIGALQAAAREFVQSPAVAGIAQVVRIESGGRTRSYRLHVPPAAAAQGPMPLLFVLHGGGGNGAQIEQATGFSRIADREGFAVVYPNGTGPIRDRLLTWNSGGIHVYASEHDVDDVAFLRDVFADASRRVAVDPERVFAAGMSNGGMMCHRLARQASDLFAGVAVVAGAMNFTAEDAATSLAVMIVHGDQDRRVLFAGGKPERGFGLHGDRHDASVEQAIAYYRAKNGLPGEPVQRVEGPVQLQTWRRTGAMPLQVATVQGGGHSWPGATPTRAGADQPADWPASERIWEFFAQVQKRLQPAAAPR